MSDPYRVMVVDDSAVVRGLVTRMLEQDPAVKVVASVGNGQMAINSLARHDVEIVVLDIEMPVMDGLTALPKLLEVDPGLQVIMASTLSHKNAAVTLRALERGAVDYVAKPTSSREISGGRDFQRELLGKVRAWGDARRRRTGPARPVAAARPQPAVVPKVPRAGGPVVLRDPSTEAPELLAIGSSTGGPQALFLVLGELGAKFPLPIVITQHMPATFTTILAEHLARVSGLPAAEGKEGEPVRGGRIYVAPGNFHMTLEQRGAERVIRLSQTPPENYCRPAVDPMLRSVAALYGKRALAVILTGMGSDGTKGCQAVVAAGGTVVAQDEATSVVWGMPGTAAAAGLCSAVLPISHIGPHIRKLVARR